MSEDVTGLPPDSMERLVPEVATVGERTAAQFAGTIAERDTLIERGDTGLYYAVSAQHGTLISRGGRPLYATLAAWKGVEHGVRVVAFIPTTGGRQTEPLFGSQPLFNEGVVPDVVGQLVNAIDGMEKMTSMLADRVMRLDKVAEKGMAGLQDISTIISQRIHFVELLDRAAALIDPDANAEWQLTTEQRLDWLAKYRETVGR